MQTSVKIKIAEVIYDVENKTFLTGRSRADGKNHVEVANMQLNDDEENRNQVLRSVTSALSELTVEMSSYLQEGYKNPTNELEMDLDCKEVEYLLGFPSNMDLTSTSVLSSSMHEYVTARAVADWFKITNKADSSEYDKIAESSLQKISEILSKRQRPERPVFKSDEPAGQPSGD